MILGRRKCLLSQAFSLMVPTNILLDLSSIAPQVRPTSHSPSQGVSFSCFSLKAKSRRPEGSHSSACFMAQIASYHFIYGVCLTAHTTIVHIQSTLGGACNVVAHLPLAAVR